MQYINYEFARFVVVGGINTVNYYLVYLLCLHLLDLHYFLSHALGFVVSLVGSFYLNVYFTYKVKPTLAMFLRFPLTQMVNTVLTAFLLSFLVEVLHINSSFAPVAAVFFTVPITFIITGRILKTS